MQAVFETVVYSGGGYVFSRQSIVGSLVSSHVRGDRWACVAELDAFQGRPVSGQDVPVRVDNVGEIHDFVVPVGSLFTMHTGTYIFAIEERRGLFGAEHFLVRHQAEVVISNGRVAAIIVGEGLQRGAVIAGGFAGVPVDGAVVWVGGC